MYDVGDTGALVVTLGVDVGDTGALAVTLGVISSPALISRRAKNPGVSSPLTLISLTLRFGDMWLSLMSDPYEPSSVVASSLW